MSRTGGVRGQHNVWKLYVLHAPPSPAPVNHLGRLPRQAPRRRTAIGRGGEQGAGCGAETPAVIGREARGSEARCKCPKLDEKTRRCLLRLWQTGLWSHATDHGKTGLTLLGVNLFSWQSNNVRSLSLSVRPPVASPDVVSRTFFLVARLTVVTFEANFSFNGLWWPCLCLLNFVVICRPRAGLQRV